MTVCLIIPPSPFLLDERVFMSLGVLKVAAALEQANVRVEVLDLSGVANFRDVARAHGRITGAVCFGVTTTTPQFPAACAIADAIRSARPDARLILGGPHPTLVHAAVRRSQKRQPVDNGDNRAVKAWRAILDRFDCVVCGDGELAILSAIGPAAPQVVDADGRQSALFLSDATLETSPWPARHLVDVGSYRYGVDGVPAMSLIAQLGCPFGCGFCAGRHSPMLRHIRKRSTANVVAEMRHMAERWGCRGFMFYDDELNVNPEMIGLMGAIAHVSRETWRLRGFIKAELFTDAQAQSMAAAGFKTILVGFESGSERILESINKRATLDDNTRCADVARRHGLKVKALMSIGHPGESEATIEETRRWLIDTQPADFDATVITPYPGSPYYDDAARNEDHYTFTARGGDTLHMRDIDYAAEADYYKGAPGAYVSHVWTDHCSAADLVRLRDGLETAVRERLNLPFNSAAAAVNYEHSMGQTALPPRLLRSSEDRRAGLPTA
jgi:anaerobic magnesium-protoporphyrin IX monomethyl ester cyclase